ncbi:exonuclease SbcCD subunit D [Haloimpatiens sp. FM7330]|uniref:metallophosphoesterase family protein n=1 Tax=Haloimpatiens sp. FM7330 TaxID=3298610 RepID=UPI00363AEC35
MTRKLRYIHAADIHLGSIPHINYIDNVYKEELIREVVYKSFEKIIDDAIKYNVDFVLISGDIFDGDSYSIKAYKFFKSQCEKLENIKLYFVCGNHDPMINEKYKMELSNNVFTFESDKPKIYNYEKDGKVIARIIGQSYRARSESRSIWKEYNLPKDEVFNIALLHTSMDGNKRYAPCTIGDLKTKECINYWALGHIHKQQIFKDENQVIAFPGIPQGRDFGELESGGYYLVDIVDDNIDVQFIKTSYLVFKKIKISIDKYKENLVNISDLEDLIEDKVNTLLEEDNDLVKVYVIQWILKGRGDIHSILNDQSEEDLEELIKEINSNFNYGKILAITDSILVRTSRAMSQIQNFEENNKFFHEIDNMIQNYMNNDELKEELVKNLGKIWDIKNDHENINEEKFLLNEEMLTDIVSEAKNLIIDELLKKLVIE